MLMVAARTRSGRPDRQHHAPVPLPHDLKTDAEMRLGVGVLGQPDVDLAITRQRFQEDPPGLLVGPGTCTVHPGKVSISATSAGDWWVRPA
jgi:hypothetical protein